MTQHSEETHAALLARVPAATGRDVREWLRLIDEGPSFSRSEERAHWLQDEYELSQGGAKALAHEYDVQRAARRNT